ncbi:MAG: C25 family cysteine peptidase, partial [Bacteroidota bacterium]
MKKIVLICFLLICLFQNKLFSQQYGNEWINYGQSYYKFKLVNEGIYKVDYQTLVDAGVGANGFDFNPTKMQLFGRDKQQPIYIVDGGDNNFGPGDYFMFHFERNNGWLDSTLFEDPNTIGNPYYCLFNDTINYFFSWSNSTNNLRYTLETTTASDLTNFPTVSPYCLVKQEFAGSGFYNEGRIEGGGFISTFSPGEGYSNTPVDGGGSNSSYTLALSFNTTNKYNGTGAPQAFFHSKTNSNSDAAATVYDSNHHLNLTIGPSNYIIKDSIFKGFKQIIINKNIPLSQLTSNSTVFNFNIINDLGALTDYQTFSYASLIYPRLTNLNGANKDKFTSINNPFQTKTRLEITSTSITTPLMFVKGTNPCFVAPLNNGGGNWSALIPSTGENREVIFQDASLLQTVGSLSPVNGTGNFSNFSNVSFEAADIMVYHPSLDSASQLYAAYRSSIAGGSYNVILSNIEELYLQFGGGIQKHNAALRRFCHFVYNNATEKPLALTILGKGYIPEKTKNTGTFPLSLIPAFGHPGSDICHTSNLQGSGFTPLIPTGRISVTTNKMLSDYLEKLKEYELQQTQTDVYDSENKDWQKQVLHFSGGATEYQQNLFFNYMNGFKSIIEGAYFAGNVTTYRKISSDPLNPTLLGELSERLHNGVSLINFFGHASSTGFDLSIDSPDNWENQKRYPIVVGNGCHSGAIYTDNSSSFGESLIRTPNEGAIAYIASTDSEYDISVQQYCNELYKQFSPNNYGRSIGEQIKKTIEALIPIAEESYLLKGTLSATNLDGDPLLKLNWHAKPEIEITEESLFFKPEDINLSVDSIEINLVMKNLGRAVTDTFQVEIKRSFPNSSIDSIYSFEYSYLNYNDTLSLKIPTQANVATGINTISVSIDLPDSEIEEQYEEYTNNKVSKTLFLKLDAIIPIYPFEFAVVPNDKVNVQASTVNPIGELKTYHFELDTTDQFNSEIKRHFTFSALGGVKEVKYNQWLDENNDSLPLICEDSVIYFWRTAIDSTVLMWNESSFQYIEGKEGWGQDHFFQFKKNNFSNVKYNKDLRNRSFQSFPRELVCDVYDHASDVNLTRYLIDGQQMEYGMWQLTPSLHLVVIDPITLKPWKNINNYPGYPDTEAGHYLGNANHLGAARYWRQESYFIYRQDSTGLNNLKNALLTIPAGHYIIVYSVNYADYSNWNLYCPSLYGTINNLGSTIIQPGLAENSFIFFTQIGTPSKTQEVLSAGLGEKISISVNIVSTEFEGEETSTLIGPAKEWQTLYWNQDSPDLINKDSTRLIIQ